MDKSRRIVITGATGFVGSYTIRLLLSNGCSNLLCMKRESSRMDLVVDVKDKVTWVNGDILDPVFLYDELKTDDVVIHTAAMVSFAGRDLNQMNRVNIEGTANLVNAALQNRVKQFIHVSSVAALGRVKSGKTMNELTEWVESDENSAYAISKQHAELEVWRGYAEGLQVAILNPSIILGGGYWNEGSTSIIGSVSKGIPFYGIGATGIVDVRDVAKMILTLIEKDINGERYVCSGTNISYKDLFQNIANAIQVKKPTKPLPKLLGEIAWRAEWLKSLFTRRSPMLTKETIRTSRFTSIYDCQKAKKELDFQFTTIDKTIADIASVYSKEQSYGIIKTG